MTTKTNLEIGFVKDQAIKQKNPLVNSPDIRISGFSDIVSEKCCFRTMTSCSVTVVVVVVVVLVVVVYLVAFWFAF